MGGKIELSYHPALKEMKFRRWENGRWVNIDPNRSFLHKYTSPNEMILQNLGSEFFDDIGKSMDGIKSITVDFRGTRLDYGDFKNMIDYYRKQNIDIAFSDGAFAELKDMESLYQVIKSFSTDIIVGLEKTSAANSVLDSTREEIQERIEIIKKKKEKLDENTVNLCVVGTYSSGKSTLINAILGYEVLPEALKSETAKMFKISTVKDFCDANVHFNIGIEGRRWSAKLEWDESIKTFAFTTEIQGSSIRKSVQSCIDDNKNEPLHVQLRQILTVINKQPNFPPDSGLEKSCEYVDGIIHLGFPIPICNDDIAFTIYDTPGTDSNYDEHLDILKKALEEQTNSILIFVNRPSRLEGTGNGMLIKLLYSIEKNASKNTIDIGRSLFVVNAADEIMKGDEGFNDLKNGVIKLRQESSSDENSDTGKDIPLQDKRLFFIAARAAYVARATKNGVANKTDIKDKNRLKWSLVEDEDAGYFKHNNMALSEYITEQMKADALEAAEKAKDNIDDLFVVNSGLFSLENEIKKYGQKFAMAVKAKSIIDATQSVVDNFNIKITALEKAKKKDREKLELDIKELRETLVGQIEDVHKTFDKKEYKESFELDNSAREELASTILEEVDGVKKVRVMNEKLQNDNKAALGTINSYLKNLYIKWDEKNKKIIKRELGFLQKSIIDKINSCKIDAETKKLLLRVPGVDLGKAHDISNVDISDHVSKFLFWKLVDKQAYAVDIQDRATEVITELRFAIIRGNSDLLLEKGKEIKNNYINNIGRYSGTLIQLRDKKESVESDLKQLDHLVNYIKEKKGILENEIWGEK